MSVETYVFTVPDSPKSVNHGGGGSRASWMAASREKKRWQDTFTIELELAKVPKGMKFCSLWITIRWRYRNRRDVENYRHPVVKPLFDALASGDWLEDDTDQFVKVEEFKFEYPDQWDNVLTKSEMVVMLEATYV